MSAAVAAAWLAVFFGLTLLAFLRGPAYGFAVYLLTFFALPAQWYWGSSVPDLRWNLLAACVFLAALVVQRMRDPEGLDAEDFSAPTVIAACLAINATAVHFFLAPDLTLSAERYSKLAKLVVLFIVISASLRTPGDLRVALWSIAAGSAYIGMEVAFNGQGNLASGRLEGVGAAGGGNSNALAALLVAVIPLLLYLFVTERAWRRAAAAGMVVLACYVVVLCGSRGAFLGLIGAAGTLVLATRGSTRWRGLVGLGLCGLAMLIFLDAETVDRFMTTFASAENRDRSAASRIVFWRAGIEMVREHPLGAGGYGFSDVYGARYLPLQVTRSVHNGYINDAAEWGLQGLGLRILLFGVALWSAWRALRRHTATGDSNNALKTACMIAGTIAFLITSVFGNYFQDEWGFWLAALIAVHLRATGQGPRPAPRPASVPLVSRAQRASASSLGPQPEATIGAAGASRPWLEALETDVVTALATERTTAQRRWQQTRRLTRGGVGAAQSAADVRGEEGQT